MAKWMKNSSAEDKSHFVSDAEDPLTKLNETITSLVARHWQENTNEGMYLAQLGSDLSTLIPNYKDVLSTDRLVDHIQEQLSPLRIIRNPKNPIQIKIAPLSATEGIDDEAFFASKPAKKVPNFVPQFWELFTRPLSTGQVRTVVVGEGAQPFYIHGSFPARPGEEKYIIKANDAHDGEVLSSQDFPLIIYNHIKNWITRNGLDESLFYTEDIIDQRGKTTSKLESLFLVLGKDAELIELPVDVAFRLSREFIE